MKDVPHHMAKFMRKLAKPNSKQTPGDEELKKEAAKEKAPSQIKKQKKSQVRKERTKRTPVHKDTEERNLEEKKRNPPFGNSKSHFNKKLYGKR